MSPSCLPLRYLCLATALPQPCVMKTMQFMPVRSTLVLTLCNCFLAASLATGLMSVVGGFAHPAPQRLVPGAYCVPCIAYCLVLLIAYCLLPAAISCDTCIAYCLTVLSIAYCLLPTAVVLQLLRHLRRLLPMVYCLASASSASCSNGPRCHDAIDDLCTLQDDVEGGHRGPAAAGDGPQIFRDAQARGGGFQGRDGVSAGCALVADQGYDQILIL